MKKKLHVLKKILHIKYALIDKIYYDLYYFILFLYALIYSVSKSINPPKKYCCYLKSLNLLIFYISSDKLL